MGCGGSKTSGNTPRGRPRGGKVGNQGSSRKRNNQPINEKGYKKRIRENLRHAAAGSDIDELRKCMEIFVNNHMEKGDDYGDAEDRLEFLLLRKEIRDACMRRHPHPLDEAIKKVEKSRYKRQLKTYLDRAYYLKQHQNELNTTDEPFRFRHDICPIDQATISEVRSYHSPPKGVHETMVASYMILGYPEKHLLDWTEITCLMGRNGHQSLLREVQTRDPNTKIDSTTALRARNYLSEYSLEQIRRDSNGAAAFYVWASDIVGKTDGKAKKGVDTTPKKLINTAGKGQQPANKPENQPKSPNTPLKPGDKSKNSAKQQKDNKSKQANGTVRSANSTAAKTTKKG